MSYFIENLFKISQDYPEGFTLDINTCKMVTTGIIVAYEETQNCFGMEGLKKCVEHAKQHDKKIGGWLDSQSGNFYYDSVRTFENLDEALEFGRKNNQIAIFDLDNLREIRL
jgi:hypothetical protein